MFCQVRQGFVFDKDKKAVTKAIRECIAQVLLKRNAKDEPSGEDKKEKEKQDDDDEQAIKTETEDSDKEQHADESEKVGPGLSHSLRLTDELRNFMDWLASEINCRFLVND